MAAKISIIVMKVDLDCKSCYKKISKTISQLQERENIEAVDYDEKNNTVTLSGPFDAKRLCKKLCCKACKVIKDIQIKEKPTETKPAEPAKPKEDKPKMEEQKKEEPKKEEPKKEVPKKEEPKKEEPKKEEPKKEEPKKEEAKPPAPKPVKEDPPPVVKAPEHGCQPSWPGPVCSCGCKPWYGGYYGNNRCPWCGRGFDWEMMAPPQVVVQPPVVMYGAPPNYYGHKTCEFFYEEEPQAACAIM